MVAYQQEFGLTLIKEMVKSDTNVSRIYGFILYTDEEPYVGMVLSNDFFWNALNAKSGSNWPIFAVRPINKGRYIFPNSSPGSFSMMIPTWDEPQRNMPVLKEFGLDSSKQLPAFVAFMWDEDDVLNEINIPIEGSNVDEVYHSLDEIVTTITRVEHRVAPEFKRTVNVFRNVAEELEALQLRNTIKRRGKILSKMAEFLSLFK